MPMVPASIRNRNPGAMEPGPSSKKFGSTSFETLRWTYNGKPAVNRIATFPTDLHGAAAMFDLLDRAYTGRTIQAAITRWCGSYHAGSYVKALAANGGIPASTKLTKELLRDTDFALPLAQSMAKVEAGRIYPMTDESWLEAHRMAFGGAVAPEFAPDNDVPSPGPKARIEAAVRDAAPKVAAGAVAAGGAGVAAIPAPPDIAPVAAWHGFGSQIADIGGWVVSNPIAAGAAVVIGAGVVFGLPMLRRD